MKKSLNLLLLSSLILVGCGNGGQSADGLARAGDGYGLTGSGASGNICSNGRLNPAEECDDGNLEDGDGCDSSCKIETGYECFYSPSKCQLICSNGRLDEGEECDDGNLDDGDGCDSTCRIENGYECDTLADPSNCELICGNGYLDGDEECDDGNSDNDDGCSECHLVAGFDCNTFVDPTSCQPWCGNGYLDEGESCDDGNLEDGDGCHECQVMEGYDCITDIEPSICRSNKKVEGLCDNPYVIAGAGSKEEFVGVSLASLPDKKLVIRAELKAGEEISSYIVSSSSSLKLYSDSCTGKELAKSTYNYNGIIYKATNDITVYLVATTSLYSYQTSPYQLLVKIRKPSCGDGLLDDGEICDDGNLDDGDGCDSHCTIERDSHCRTKYAPAENTIHTALLQKYSECESGVSDYTGHGDSCAAPAVLLGRSGSFSAGVGAESWTSKCSFKSPYNSYNISCSDNQDIVFAVTLQPLEKFTISDDNSTLKVAYLDQCNPDQGTIIASSSSNKLSYTNTDDGPHTLFVIAKTSHYKECGSNYSSYPIDKDVFTYTVESTNDEPELFCGDGIKTTDRGESCDDGNNISGDGCSAECKIEADWSCPTDGRPCQLKYRVPAVGTLSYDATIYNRLCNDGNDYAGDGCFNWHVEAGWSCWQEQENNWYLQVPCYKLCGNTKLDDGEECDDGNQIDGDGCSKLCQVEAGYTCSGLHCYQLQQKDEKHGGSSPADAITMAAEKFEVTLSKFTANGYKLDSSCEDNQDDSSDLKALFFKVDLKVGQMLKGSFASTEEEKQFSVNYVRSVTGDKVTCYRKDHYGKFFGSREQPVTMIVKQKTAAAVGANFRVERYYPICGDGVEEGFEQCDPGTPMKASRSYKYCENCMLVGNDAGDKSCSWVATIKEYLCTEFNHYSGYAGSCGGAAVHDGQDDTIETYFHKTSDETNEFVQANYTKEWEPDIASCTGGDTSFTNHYSFIVRYDLKAGDKLSFVGDVYNSYSSYVSDHFYIVGDDCWHGQCLYSSRNKGSWTADKDRQVWAIVQHDGYWIGDFNSAFITLERAK